MNTTHKPCPRCGNTNLFYEGRDRPGHGDCTFEAWIRCKICGYRDGFVENWGSYRDREAEARAWSGWNNIPRAVLVTPTREQVISILEDYQNFCIEEDLIDETFFDKSNVDLFLTKYYKKI